MKMKMLIVAAVLLFGAVLASADDAAPKCGLLERVKVGRQWNHAYGEGQHRIEFVIDVWTNYFKAFPKSRDLFKDHRGDNVYSVEFQAHGHRVLGALGLLIATADEPETLKVILAKLKSDTTTLGTGAEYLESFRHELLDTLPHHIGNHFDYDAWNNCLGVIIGAIKH